MDQRHSRQQGNDSNHHHFVFEKEAFSPFIPTDYADQNDCKGGGSTPPAYEQGGIVLKGGAWARRVLVIYAPSDERH